MMEPIDVKGIQELTPDQIDHVSGGAIFVAALYPAFVSGAKWGAGIALATLGAKMFSK